MPRDFRGTLSLSTASQLAHLSVPSRYPHHRPSHLTRNAALAAALLPFVLLPTASFTQEKTDTAKTTRTHAPSGLLMELQDAFSTIADQLEPAVVTVLSSKSIRGVEDGGNADPLRGMLPLGRGKARRSTGTGSGVIISKDGWVLTNDHVVGGADKVTVRLHDGREFTGVVRRDYRSDLALVKVTSPTPLPMAKLGDSDKVKIGHWALAIGSPYRYEGSFSVGVISSLFRSQTITDFNSFGRPRYYPNMIQTDAAINPGNSGGPLCNIEGEVIAINTAIESEGGGSVGIGFAIPINSAKFVIAQLLEKGRVSYGFLGISPTSVTPRLASALNVERGALLDTEPDATTPAAKAGLHAGDVVTAINTKPIRNEIELRTTIAQTLPNTTIELTVVRNGQEKALKATLTEAPDTVEDTSGKPRVTEKASLGIEVQPITDRLAEQAGVPPKTAGVVIKSINPNSPAADLEELTEGLVVLKVNNTDTPNVQAFQNALAKLKSGDQVRLLYQKNRITHFIIVMVE